jgi:hypothetical protein
MMSAAANLCGIGSTMRHQTVDCTTDLHHSQWRRLATVGGSAACSTIRKAAWIMG